MAPPLMPSLPGFMFPVKRKKIWNTAKADALSGKKTRLGNWTYPQYGYQIGYDFLRSDPAHVEWQTLEGFIDSVAGAAGLFLYNDVNDNTAAAQLFGAGDGVTTTFQLVRTIGGFAAPVFAPVLSAGLVTQVTVGGTPTTAYSVSPYGQIIFTAAPALGQLLQWTGTFYWACYFDDDTTEFVNDLQNWFSVKSLNFTTSKLP